MPSDSSNREITEEKADDELLEEGELEGGDDSKETQRKSKSRRKPKGKKLQPEEGKTLMLEPTVNSCYSNMVQIILRVICTNKKSEGFFFLEERN